MAEKEENDSYSQPIPKEASGGDIVPELEKVPFIDVVKQKTGLPDNDAKKFMTREASKKKKENDAAGKPTTRKDVIDAILEGLGKEEPKKDNLPAFRTL